MAGRNHDRQSSGGGIWKIAFVAILGSLIGQIDATIVNISLPELVNRLDSELATIQWVISGYLLALALALPLSGWLVDRVGGRRTYLICFPAFTGASILCACAWSDLSLIAFRIIQGVSGGVLAPMTQIMMARAAGNRLPQVMGYAAMPILVAPILGPVIAGGVLEHLSWRWLFLITVPFGILATIMAWLVLPDDRGDIRRTPFDFLGFSLLAPGITVLLYSLSAAAWRLLPLALVLLAGFVLTALRRRKVSIINLELFGNRDFFASVAIQFFSNATSFAGQMLIPLFLIEAGFSESETGLFIAPIGVGMLLGYPMLGFLTKRFGIRWVSTTGALLAACATVPLIIMALQGVNQFLLIAALFLRGAGMSLISVPSVTAAYASLGRDEIPHASTTLNIVQRLGGPIFTTVCATFLGWRMATLAPQASGIAVGEVFVLLLAVQSILLILTLRLPIRLGEASRTRPHAVMDSHVD